MKMFLSVLALTSMVASINGCAAPTSAETQRATASHIIGGTLDTKHTSVGLIRSFDAKGNVVGFCSGTVVAPRVVVTAGHCAFANSLSTGPRAASADISFDDKPNQDDPPGGGSYIGGQLTPHPLFDDVTAADGTFRDAAVLLLVKDAPVAPVQLAKAPSVTSSITTVGFGDAIHERGNQAAANDGFGQRRQLSAKVLRLSEDAIQTQAANGGTFCHGDSGGPLLIDGKLAGIVSHDDSTDGTCRGTDHFTRIDALGDFLPQFLDLGSSGGGWIDRSNDVEGSVIDGFDGCDGDIIVRNGKVTCDGQPLGSSIVDDNSGDIDQPGISFVNGQQVACNGDIAVVNGQVFCNGQPLNSDGTRANGYACDRNDNVDVGDDDNGGQSVSFVNGQRVACNGDISVVNGKVFCNGKLVSR